MWRRKDMTAEEIDAFLRAFRSVYDLSILNHDMALFVHRDAGEPGGTVAMTGYQSVFLEIAAPGGWTTCPPPRGDDWSLLAGNPRTASAPESNPFLAVASRMLVS